MQSAKRVLRTPQAAEYVGLSASTLEKLRLTGNGPAFQKAGAKIVVYFPEELDRWLNAQRCLSTSDATRLRRSGSGASNAEADFHIKLKGGQRGQA